MDPTGYQNWTSSEVEEARSLVARVNNNKIIYHNNYDNNKKHNDIVNALRVLFPSKTVQQVTILYINLVAEMNMMKQREGSHVTGDSTNNICTVHDLVNGNFGESGNRGASGTHHVCTIGDLVKGYNFGVQEEATTMGGTVLAFGCPLEHTRIMDMEEALPMVEKNKMEVLDNNFANDKPVVAPHQGRFWTTDEHRLFLRGLSVYGRGDWKNISRHFVTTKTAIQVSSHAQKYFKRLEKRTLSGKAGRQRYSINDVGLHDDDPWAAENSSGPWQALGSTGLNNDPSFESQTPASSFITNDPSQFWSPTTISSQLLGQEPLWSEQQMMDSLEALMEAEEENFVPACQQGSAYFPPGNL